MEAEEEQLRYEVRRREARWLGKGILLLLEMGVLSWVVMTFSGTRRETQWMG